jgi:hypothetical protein
VTNSERADLDSALNTIEQLIERIAGTAESHAHDESGSVSSELFEVERALQTAARRLETAIRALPD